MQGFGKIQMNKSTFCHPTNMETAECKTTLSEVMNVTPTDFNEKMKAVLEITVVNEHVQVRQARHYFNWSYILSLMKQVIYPSKLDSLYRNKRCNGVDR